MRNLYSRLSLNTTASFEEIGAAIAVCKNAAIKADATAVLLSEDRKRTYDRLNATLTEIGYLRAALGLSHADHWPAEEAAEYANSSLINRAKYPKLVAKIKNWNRGRKIEEFVKSVKDLARGFFKILAGIAVLIGGIWWFSTSIPLTPAKQTLNKPPQPETPRPISEWLYDIGDDWVPVDSATPPPLSSKPAFTHSALPLPYNGTTRQHTSTKAVAPLEIKTTAGNNYLVKLEHIRSNLSVMDIFVRGGSTVEVSVPLGSYIVKYAVGETWYGYEHYFGPDTSYFKADSIFRFRIENNRIAGYTITLYSVVGGNLSTSNIGPAQF